MQAKEKSIDSDYAEWIHKEWTNQGGLIQPQVAAEILNVSITRIKQMRDEGKLKEFKDPRNRPMLSFSQVMEIQNNRLKDYNVSYDIDIIDYTDKTETKHKEDIFHQTTPPKKENIINEVKNQYQGMPEEYSIRIYNIKITQIIE